MDKQNGSKKDWTATNERARALAGDFLHTVGRPDLAKYFDSGRQTGISIDWRFYFDDSSVSDDDCAGLELRILSKRKEKPSGSPNASNGRKEKAHANGLPSRILSLFRI